MITDHLMLDVLRSTTMVFGELCAIMTLTTTMHKLPASCSDLGEFLSDFRVFIGLVCNGVLQIQDGGRRHFIFFWLNFNNAVMKMCISTKHIGITGSVITKRLEIGSEIE